MGGEANQSMMGVGDMGRREGSVSETGGGANCAERRVRVATVVPSTD